MSHNGNFELIPIDEVKLDLSNPRIAGILPMYENEVTAEQIYLALGAYGGTNAGGTTFLKLRASVQSCGRIINPIVVNQSDGVRTCIDGNTRLALYREFLKTGVRGEWTSIPAVVHDNLSQNEIDEIRLGAHLVGPRPWEPYSKGKYLHQLRKEEHIPWRDLVDYCGGSQKEVEEFISAYVDMEDYYRPLLSTDGDFDPQRFSGFRELQKTGVKQAIISAGHDLTDFARWIHERKIGALHLVRQLPKIFRSDEAHQIFLREDAASAIRALDTPDLSDTLKEVSLPDLCRAVVAAYNNMPHSEFKQLEDNPGSDEAEAVRYAYEVLDVLTTDLNKDQ